jgi:hypothetical protein
MKADILQLPTSQLDERAQLTISLLTSYARAIINTPCPLLQSSSLPSYPPSPPPPIPPVRTIPGPPASKNAPNLPLFNLLNPPFSYSEVPLGSAFTTTGTRLA